jgi:excisionase family DNA binding protein
MTGTLGLDVSSTHSIAGGDDDHELLAGYPPVLTVGEVAGLIRRSRSRTYTLIRSGKLRSVKIGGSRRILRLDLERFLIDAQ